MAELEALRPFAARYVWWKTPEEALSSPQRVIAQVMNIGDFDDVLALISIVGEEAMVATIKSAEAGQFSAKSWTYWHYRLGLAELDQVPPLPVRSFA